MPRPSGSRNRDYDATRRTLIDALSPHLLDNDGEPNTVKALAATAGVSVPTLKHYFTDRDGVVQAVLQQAHAESERHLTAMTDRSGDDPQQLLTGLLIDIADTWRRHGLGRLFASTLALGLENRTLGPTFVNELLEPLLQAVEQLLAGLVNEGALPPVDLRTAALGLVGPVLLALLHQDNLSGAHCRPLEVEHFARQHVHLILHGLLHAP